MLRLVINAVSLASGGGVNGLVGYLRAWQEIGSPLDITLFASRTPVLDSVRAVRPDIRVVPYAVSASSGRHFLLQQMDLARHIHAARADVVLATQTLVGRCRVPQLVHHRNLKRFCYPHLWRRVPRDGFDVVFRDWAARKALREAACNVFISDYMRREAERFVPESSPRNHVIHNALSSKMLGAAQQGGSEWQGRPHLIAVQAPAKHKDNPTLLRTLAYLLAKEPQTPWELTVVGPWDWSEEQAMAREMGLADQVHFLGYLSHDQMDPLLRDSVCLVFTTILEGFGNPPLEAMARSCPTIACNVTAMPEVIGDAGILVEPHRHDQFGDAVLRLFHDRAFRGTLVQRGLERIQLFKWSDSAAKMHKLLESTASESSFDARTDGSHVSVPTSPTEPDQLTTNH